EGRGGTIYERSRVTAADLDGLRKSVWTEHGRVRAFQVVLAGSAFLGEAFPALAATVLPVRTHVAVTAPLGDVLKDTIRYPGAIADTRGAGRAATQAAYWSMQFKDWMDEAQTKRIEQVQADIAAGLAPGLAAFAARRAKHKFVESRAGRAGARFASTIYFFLNRLLVGVR